MKPETLAKLTKLVETSGDSKIQRRLERLYQRRNGLPETADPKNVGDHRAERFQDLLRSSKAPSTMITASLATVEYGESDGQDIFTICLPFIITAKLNISNQDILHISSWINRKARGFRGEDGHPIGYVLTPNKFWVKHIEGDHVPAKTIGLCFEVHKAIQEEPDENQGE